MRSYRLLIREGRGDPWQAFVLVSRSATDAYFALFGHAFHSDWTSDSHWRFEEYDPESESWNLCQRDIRGAFSCQEIPESEVKE